MSDSYQLGKSSSAWASFLKQRLCNCQQDRVWAHSSVHLRCCNSIPEDMGYLELQKKKRNRKSWTWTPVSTVVVDVVYTRTYVGPHNLSTIVANEMNLCAYIAQVL